MYTLCVCLCKCVVYLRKQHPLRLQIQTHPVTLVIQEVLQPQELDSTERAPVPPVHGDLQLPRLQDKATCSTSTQQHNAAPQRSNTTQHHRTAAQRGLLTAGPSGSVTRSSSSVNFWSQAWLLAGLQFVCPTTVLSSFSTALISSAESTRIRIILVLFSNDGKRLDTHWRAPRSSPGSWSSRCGSGSPC